MALNADPCDPSTTWAVVDMALAMASLSSGYVESYGVLEPGEDRGRYIWVGALGGLAMAASASLGFKRAKGCDAFLAHLGRSSFREGFTEDALQPDPIAMRRGADLITAEDLTEVADRSVYEAIQLLRSQWLRRTGFRDDLPSVIMDNQPFELQILETMRPDQVAMLRFISPSDATVRWGTGYPSGVIEVLTRPR